MTSSAISGKVIVYSSSNQGEIWLRRLLVIAPGTLIGAANVAAVLNVSVLLMIADKGELMVYGAFSATRMTNIPGWQ